MLNIFYNGLHLWQKNIGVSTDTRFCIYNRQVVTFDISSMFRLSIISQNICITLYIEVFLLINYLVYHFFGNNLLTVLSVTFSVYSVLTTNSSLLLSFNLLSTSPITLTSRPLKKSAIEEGMNYVSYFMGSMALDARARLKVNEIVLCVGLNGILMR